MAPTHVSNDQLPQNSQSIYPEPTYEGLYPAGQSPAQSWNTAPHSHSSLAPNNFNGQTWHHSTFAQQSYNPISQPYVNQGHGYQTTTASPYQYGQFGNHGSAPTYGQASNVDPSLSIDPNTIRQQQQSPYQPVVQNAPPPTQSNTVAPQALQQGLPSQSPRTISTPYQIPKTTAELFAKHAVPAISAKSVRNPEYEIPKGRRSGGFVIVDQAALVKATKSNPLNKLVTFGFEPFHLPSNRTALPQYTPRQSVRDLKRAGADNKKLVAKKSTTKSLSTRTELKADASDSESYDDSSEDDSDYSDDEDVEQSPLPPSRPDEMHGATRYDIIKATWYPRRSQPSSEKIKASLRDFWEIVNTIQKRWRIDSKAVSEAEEKKNVTELPVLKSRVASGRDLLQSALKTALEHAHPDVLYHVGQVKPFLYSCYLFLANRSKMQDYDGGLSSAIYEILARCVGTLTTELLEETKVIKALNLMKKNANDKNKAVIQQIVEGAAAGSKKAKVSSPPEVEATAETKTGKKAVSQTPATRIIKSTEPAINGQKKPATATASKLALTTSAAQQKRPGDKTAQVPAKARGTQIVNKPSTLFASLNAAGKKPPTSSTATSSARTAAKPTVTAVKEKKPTPAPAAAKPGFSFAETMAQLLKPKEEKPAPAPAKSERQLPPETAEEKARRLRKESRRHLRVTFRPDAALVDIRYFHHHPEEESGHDENFLRDAGDIGGEGRMFKQHKEMMDEDEDEDVEMEYQPWKEPSLIDFSVVDSDERGRNYEPFGGGKSKPSCPEREANIRHENSTLMVFYSHPSDIPSSPREPLEQQTQTPPSAPAINFGLPPELVTSRVPKGSMPAPTPDFSNLENMIKQLAVPSANPPQVAAPQSSYAPVPTPAAPVPAPPPDLASILSALGQLPGQAPAQAPAQAQMPFLPVQPPAPAQAPPVDMNAILAAIASAGNPAFQQVAPPPGWPAFPSPYPPTQPSDIGVTYQSQSPTQHNQHSRGGHKRQREEANDNDRGHDFNKKNKNSQDRPLDKSSIIKRHKVIPCRFFQKGMCSKGDDCTYIHDLNM